MDDCDGEYALFQHLVKQLPREELQVIDMTLRMYLEPQFILDRETLQHVHTDTVNAKKALIAKLPPDILPSQLSSNPQMAQLLEKFGVEVPMKISPTTDKPTYAFAKNDMGWKELEDEYMDDPLIAPILAARLGIKSTLAESRSKRLMDVADAFEWFRIPLRYYAAHTGRYGGMEKLNAQNFTRVNPKLGHRRQLRYGLKAPPGKSVLAPDLSQIEARLNAWLSGCNTLLEIFRRGGDPYCEFASKAFRRPVTKADETERFIGKTCILGLGYGMGFKKLRATLRKDGVKITEQQAYDFVQVYRSEYREIPAMWKFCGTAMEIMCNGGATWLGPCRAEHQKIVLPNNMPIMYHNLRWIETKKYSGYVYDFAGQGRTLWGGKVVENICQSLARIIIAQNMRQIKNELGLQPALQAHDELVYVVDTTNVEYYRGEILRMMTIPPGFAPDLPMGAEAEFGPTYGDAK
jgi:DNA polymerase